MPALQIHLRFERIRLAILRWSCAEDGVAAIEFAFIAPVMMIMFFGTLEAGRAYSMYRRFNNTANMIGDLVTRENKVVHQRGDLRPYSTVDGQLSCGRGNIHFQVIPLIPQPNNASAGRVYAGTAERPAYGTMTAQNKCASETLSTKQAEALVGKTSGMLLLRAEYKYTPMFASTLGFGDATWKMETLIGPRYGCLSFPGNETCTATCP